MARKISSSQRLVGVLTAFLGLIFIFQAEPVWAQTELELQPPSSALACLQVQAGPGDAPTYPASELAAKSTAKVRVRLTFHSPDLKPTVNVLSNTGVEAFEDAVEAFVKRYRLPCFVQGSTPLIVAQDFDFELAEGRSVVYSEVSGVDPAPLGDACFKRPMIRPPYPARAIAAGEGGTVLAEAIFREMNAEPLVRIIYDARSASLAAAVTSHMKDYRLVCPMQSAEPIKATQAFVFAISAKDRHVIRDMTLVGFLRSVAPADLRDGKFNLNTMACPFDISVRARKPHADNLVAEYGQPNPKRKEFLNWLKGLTVQLPAELEPYLFDQQLKVSVPCTRLDL